MAKDTVIQILSTDGRITVVTGRLGDDVRPGTYRAILKHIGIGVSLTAAINHAQAVAMPKRTGVLV